MGIHCQSSTERGCMTDIFYWIGVSLAVFSAWFLLLAVAFGLCLLSNRVSHLVLDCYGGWKTFIEYKEWYYANHKGGDV